MSGTSGITTILRRADADAPKKMSNAYREISMDPNAPLNEEETLYRSEYLRINRVATTLLSYGWQQYDESRKPGYKNTLAPLVNLQLQELVKTNPLEVKGKSESELSTYYSELATMKAENVLAFEVMKRNRDLYPEIPSNL